MKKIFPFLFILTAVLSCKNEPRQNSDEKNPTLIKQTDILLICQEVKQEDEETGAPVNEVFFQLAESKVKVADILSCETISPENYDQYQIPKQAISAVGGWWAGAGDYLYVIEEGGNYVVRKGGIFEESEDGNYNYEIIAKYSKSGVLMTND